MPDITPAEQALLNVLTAPAINTLGKARMKQVADFIYRLMNIADEAFKENEATKLLLKEKTFESAALAVAALGIASKEDIQAKKSLSEPMRKRCLTLRQQFDDASKFRAMQGVDDSPEDYLKITQPDEATQ